VIVSRAPFRISLGGGGTDLPSYYQGHGGFILSAAINKYIYISINSSAVDDLIRLKYSVSEEVASVDEIKHDLVRPALKQLGILKNVEIASMADLPAGTGLGSSSTYLVALLVALHRLKRENLPTQALAEQAIDIEMNLAGHPVGKQDHYLAAFGGITCLEIARDGRVEVSPLKVSTGTIEEFRNSVLLMYTGITRRANDILEAQKKDSQAGNAAVLDSLHFTKELGYKIKEALEKGELYRFGQYLDDHWQNKKKRSGSISDGRIDRWYTLARENGSLGGKIMGAGGGGFFMFYCPNGSKQRVRKALVESGLREMPWDFDTEGAKVLVNF